MTGADDQRRALRQYLSLGFLPDADLASAYVHDLFGTPAAGKCDPSSLLVEIVADLTGGAPHIAIPLTGGRDSRALLGAALQVYCSRDISCVTFGCDGSADVEGARAVCRNAKVHHRVIDPDGFRWDLEALTAEVRRRLLAGAGVTPIDGLVVFTELARAVPAAAPALSGYLGDATIGRHLKGRADEDHSEVLALFHAHNRVVLDDRPDSLFRNFLDAHRGLRDSWPGLTNFDLLDFGFRQRLRIRPAVSGSFDRPLRVYENRRWIAHWFGQPLATRLNFLGYDDVLRRAFPLVFGRLPLGSRIRRWRSRRRGWAPDRGDPRRNPSMAAALGEACRAFDERGVAPAGAATAAFSQLMEKPEHATFERVRWFATAEALARAQGLP